MRPVDAALQIQHPPLRMGWIPLLDRGGLCDVFEPCVKLSDSTWRHEPRCPQRR